MTQLVAFTGYAQVGKSLAASIAAQILGGIDCAVSDALNAVLYAQNPIVMMPLNEGDDAVRLQELVDEVGFEDAKKLWPEVRELQKALGNAVRDHIDPNIWIGKIIYAAKQSNKPIAVSGIRFLNEVRAISLHDGKIIRIERPGFEAESDFEKEVDGLPHNFKIVNNGTVEDLATTLYIVLQHLGLLDTKADVDPMVQVNDDFNRMAREAEDRKISERAAAKKAAFEQNGGDRTAPMTNPFRVDL